MVHLQCNLYLRLQVFYAGQYACNPLFAQLPRKAIAHLLQCATPSRLNLRLLQRLLEPIERPILNPKSSDCGVTRLIAASLLKANLG